MIVFFHFEYIFPTAKAKELVADVKKDLDHKLMVVEQKIGEEQFSKMVSLLESVNEVLENEEWNLKAQIKRAEEIQRELEANY